MGKVQSYLNTVFLLLSTLPVTGVEQHMLPSMSSAPRQHGRDTSLFPASGSSLHHSLQVQIRVPEVTAKLDEIN